MATFTSAAQTGAPVVAVIGGGPAGLIASEVLASRGVRVVVFEKMASVGRKFLLAGRGGLNLTHSEDLDQFLARYSASSPLLAAAVRAFPPSALRDWAEGLGEATFVGSSGRVFPASFRATPLLRAWMARLQSLGVEVRVRHRWHDWPVVVADRDGRRVSFAADAVVVALGGASWPRTGSNGEWVASFVGAGVRVSELRPANAGVRVAWSDVFRRRFAGTPLKDVCMSVGDFARRGDAVVTERGLEGGVVYAIGAPVRAAVDEAGAATVCIDLRPDVALDELAARLARRRPKASVSSWLRAAGLAPVAISLLREATGNDVPLEPTAVASLLKAAPVHVEGVEPIDRAISTAGGVRFDELDDRFMLRDRPGTFVAGEMLDWEAPTGGYLLQGCFSTGVAAAHGALAWLDERV